MDTKSIIIWVIFLGICAAIFLVSQKMKNQIEKNGIETTGVISRIEEDGGAEDISYSYYAKYHVEDGQEIEGLVSNPNANLAVGQQVRLKYHPKYKQNARLL